MSDVPHFGDPDAARQDGEAFGRQIGSATAAEMARVGPDADKARIAGVEGADTIMARAAWLGSVKADRDLVQHWTDAAAEAFTEELDRAAALLAVAPVTDLKN